MYRVAIARPYGGSMLLAGIWLLAVHGSLLAAQFVL
jgi:hypothetical protein